MAKTKSRRIKAVDTACESTNKKSNAIIVLLVILISLIVIVPIVVVYYAINMFGGMIPDFSSFFDMIPTT